MIRLTLPTFVLAAILAGPLAAQSQADRDAIHDVMRRYAELEDAMDMATQAQLMTEDRVWITPSGRQLDQQRNMEVQQKVHDLRSELYPGHQIFTEIRYPHLYFPAQDVAVYSYWWDTSFLPTADHLRGSNRELTSFTPSWRTAVLVKRDGEWKIAHTHVSPINQGG